MFDTDGDVLNQAMLRIKNSNVYAICAPFRSLMVPCVKRLDDGSMKGLASWTRFYTWRRRLAI